MKKYSRLNLQDREEISRRLDCGESLRSIARTLRRDPSTISREVNQCPNLNQTNYRAVLADYRSLKLRKLQGRKRIFDKYPKLRRVILSKLQLRWSPDQIVKYLEKRYPRDTVMRISSETIYVAIHILPKGELRRSLTSALRQQRKFRRKSTKKGKGKLANIPNPTSIDERPKSVETREVAGHWEGYLILGRWKQSALCTLVERKTRFVKLIHLTKKDHNTVRKGIEQRLNRLPLSMRQSLTWDRGGEMSSHQKLTAKINILVYFAHPGSPWERGTNENTNMLIRQFFPKGTDFNKVSKKEIKYVERLLNQRIRKSLNWRTPEEVFREEVLR